jgi:hypothetical protein
MERAKFRPMRVKEERALLTADASENGSVMINTLHNVVKSCVEMIETKYLTSFDLEYLFTQIRAKSVGEITTLYLLCDTPGCEDVEVRYEYHLSDIKVVFPEGVSDIIKLSDDLAIKMRYPSVDEAIDIEL